MADGMVYEIVGTVSQPNNVCSQPAGSDGIVLLTAAVRWQAGGDTG